MGDWGWWGSEVHNFAGTLILFVVYAHIKPLHIFQPIFNWVGEGMADINELVDWALIPVFLFVKTLFRGIAMSIRHITNVFHSESAIVSQKGRAAFDIDCDKEKKEATKP